MRGLQRSIARRATGAKKEPVELEVARHIVSTRYEDLPADAIRATKEHILHTIATALAGSSAAGCSEFMTFLKARAGKPQSSVLAWGGRVPVDEAAMANSLMAHAQEFDNNDDRIAYKSTVCAVPAALAVAESLGRVHGRDLIVATCIGIDLGIRMGLAILPQPAHPTAYMLGPFVAAATAAKLMRLEPLAIWNALGLALCGVSSTGVSTTGLSWSKRYLAGAASRNGVSAALLAAEGYLAQRPVFSGADNYFRAVHGRDGDLGALMNNLGRRFEVVNVGPKAYPSCRYTHPSVDAILALTIENDLQPADIAEIRVTIGSRDYQSVFGGDDGLAAKQAPDNVVDAQFSIPYTVAAALTARKLFLDDMSEKAIARPKVIALARRVVPVVDPSLDNWPFDVKPSTVEVRTVRGASFRRRVDYPRGNPINPVPFEEMRRNFLGCAEYAVRPLPKKNVERALGLIETLEKCTDVREIALLLTPRPKKKRA